MARNVEIKARSVDPGAHMAHAEMVSGDSGVTIEQEDVFYHCDSGRLKLRILPDGQGELIHYHRPDRAGPKTSDYVMSGIGDPAGLHAVLDRAFGVMAVVRKTRRLFMAGRTRIHIDSVDGLGDFVELEVVLNDGEDASAGELEAAELMTRLGIDDRHLVSGAYVDLLAAVPVPEQGRSHNDAT